MSDSPTWLERRRRQHASQLPPLGLPAKYRDLPLQGIETPVFQRAAITYLQEFWTLAAVGKAPALLGRAGTYKTFTAAVIAQRVHAALLDALFIQCGPEFQELERRRFDAHTELRIKALETTTFVVLDDFTKVKPGSYGMDLLDAVVERRYADGLPTLYTGNVIIKRDDDSALVEHVGAGFARRLKETSAGLIAVAK